MKKILTSGFVTDGVRVSCSFDIILDILSITNNDCKSSPVSCSHNAVFVILNEFGRSVTKTVICICDGFFRQENCPGFHTSENSQLLRGLRNLRKKYRLQFSLSTESEFHVAVGS